MQRPWTRAILVLTAVVLVGGCSDDGPTGPDDTEEFEAVVNALNNSGALGAVGIYAAFVPAGEISFGNITVNEGSLAEAVSRAAAEARSQGWQALAIEVNLDFTDPDEGQIQEGWTAVAAWTGLDVDAQTVDQAITTLALSDALADNSADLATEEALAYVVDYTTGADGTLYLGSEGTFNVTSKTFSSPTPLEGSGAGQVPYDITYATGTISGGFDFIATDFAQPPTTVTRSSAFPGLPAVQINVTGGSG